MDRFLAIILFIPITLTRAVVDAGLAAAHAVKDECRAFVDIMRGGRA